MTTEDQARRILVELDGIARDCGHALPLFHDGKVALMLDAVVAVLDAGPTRPKRFLLFCGIEHYAAGGINDCAGAFDTVAECRAEFERLEKSAHFSERVEWFQVVDTTLPVSEWVVVRQAEPHGDRCRQAAGRNDPTANSTY